MYTTRPMAILTGLAVVVTTAASTAEMTAADVIAKLKENPFPSAYTADMDVAMTSMGMPMDMTGTMAFDHGAMKMVSTMKMQGQVINTTMTMDANGMQWIETDMPATGMKQVMKMDMAVIMEELGDLPGASLIGQGGMNFQPTPEMYDTWLESMDMEYEGLDTVDGEECYVLSGSYKESFIEQLDPNGNMRAMGALPDRTTMRITTATSFPVQIEMESAQGINGTVTMSNVNLEPEFESNAFSYTPPDGITPVDTTEIVRQQVNMMRGPDASN